MMTIARYKRHENGLCAKQTKETFFLGNFLECRITACLHSFNLSSVSSSSLLTLLEKSNINVIAKRNHIVN